MSASPESEKAEQTEDSATKPLPHGFLNALDETLHDKIPWIIENLLAEGEQMLVFGAPKVGKSQFALQLAMSLALGEPFLNWPIVKRRRVLYLNFEMGKHFFMLRIARHYCHARKAKEMQEGLDSDPENRSEESKWLDFKDETPPDRELLKKINEGIKDYLFFCGELRGLESKNLARNHDPDEKDKTHRFKSNAEKNKEEKEEKELAEQKVVKQWQAIMDEIKPELIIFDTLSKTHAINESNNSEIQGVLLRLREISTLAIPSANDSGNDGSNSGGVIARKEIAHVIIHHARKLPGDSYQNGGNFVSLDNIRGGSAIRAEADLIFGIFSKANKPTSTHKATNRTISIESRNLSPDMLRVNFTGWTFRMAEPQTEAEEESLGEILTEHIRHAFVQSGMRGLMIKTLLAKVRAGLEKTGKASEFSNRELDLKLKSLAGQAHSQFEIREKTGVEEETAKYPHERGGGVILYWIKEGSPWLNEEPLFTAISNHKPYPPRKGGKPEKP